MESASSQVPPSPGRHPQNNTIQFDWLVVKQLPDSISR